MLCGRDPFGGKCCLFIMLPFWGGREEALGWCVGRNVSHDQVKKARRGLTCEARGVTVTPVCRSHWLGRVGWPRWPSWLEKWPPGNRGCTVAPTPHENGHLTCVGMVHLIVSVLDMRSEFRFGKSVHIFLLCSSLHRDLDEVPYVAVIVLW